MSHVVPPSAAVPSELPAAPAALIDIAPADSAEPAAVAAQALPAGTPPSVIEMLLLRAHPWLGLLAVGAVLVLASWLRHVLVPILIALLLALTLAPALRILVGWRIPRMLGAALLMLLTVAGSIGILSLLAEPAQEFARDVPAALERLERHAAQWRQPLEAASDAAQRLTGSQAQGSANGANLGSGLFDAVVGVLVQAPLFVASIFATFFLAFMMLVHSDASLRKLVGLLPSLSQAKDLIGGTRQAQHELSRYMLVITCINLGLGVATTVLLSLLGVDNAILWGGVAALANFAPYVGPALVTLMLALVGFGQHAQLGAALLVPVSFLILTTIEGQVVSPLLVGRHLRLDPLVIILALVLLGWLWGIAGLLIAVPLLTCVRVISERLHSDGRLATILTAAR
jgi:predicted PurR-regulated permease PerM